MTERGVIVFYMQQRFIQHTDCEGACGDNDTCRRLILFFAGWGMDASVFSALSKPGYDILLVYDYRDDDFDESVLGGYDEICVLAWSLGVWHADRFISSHSNLPITRTVAVNGTLCPINDSLGIPPRIYDLTSALPDERALAKFYRRICGGQGMGCCATALYIRLVLSQPRVTVRCPIVYDLLPLSTSFST